MNDQLYREAKLAAWNSDSGAVKIWVMPVEPCEHGNYDAHKWLDGGDTFVGDGGQWLDPANYTARICEGAALKGTTNA